jgi:BirA family biotin operon repressor/biotin-[acetyl-CoA-carboxylase] ligase
VSQLRLRWPNDLMVGPAKLAGILVERFSPETAVVGIGINLLNDPVRAQPELAGQVARLADLVPTLPSREQVLATLLALLAEAQSRIQRGETHSFLPELNEAWRIRRVSLSLHDQETPLSGDFLGVDALGNLLLQDTTGRQHRLSPLAVALLRECS